MKFVKWIIAVSLFFIALTAMDYGDAQASASTSETKVSKQTVNQTKYVKSEGGLIVRKEAHSKGAKVDMLKNGSKVFVYSTDTNGWSYVKQGSLKGYVKDSYLVDIEQDSHYSKQNKNRVIDFSMSIAQVKKAETAKLLENLQDATGAALVYAETKYGYSTELIYFFDNKKLAMIIFDFFPYEDRYSDWSEIELIHDLLYEEGIKEFGEALETRSDNLYNIETLWDKGSYYVLLDVNRESFHTNATFTYLPKSHWTR